MALIKLIRNYITALFRIIFFNSSTYKNIRKKNRKLLIVGNATKQDLNLGKYKNYDLLLINNGPANLNLNPHHHLFELPTGGFDQKKNYIEKNKIFNTNSIKVFRPNSFEEFKFTNDIKNIIVPSEVRLVYPTSISYLRLQFYLARKFNLIPYYRSSISFAIALGNFLNYEEILLKNINPYNTSNPHNTGLLVDGTNVYKFLNYCKEKKILRFKKDEDCIF